MLKTTQYFRTDGVALGVAYAIFKGGNCVFTALEEATRGSSINYAEDIALAIARAESQSVQALRFFDLQTRSSYSPTMWTMEPGSFEFEEVVLKPDGRRLNGILAEGWRLVECPQCVIDSFWMFFDGEPHQSVPRKFEATF